MSKDLTQSAQPPAATTSTLSSQIIPPKSLLGQSLGLPSTSEFDSPFRSEEKKLTFREFQKEYERILDADETLKRYQVYCVLSITLQRKWFRQIPLEVRNVLSGFDGNIDLPCLFVVWRAVGNVTDPISYPLPAPLQHFPRISFVQAGEHGLSVSLFDETDKETPLGHAVSQAWDHVSEDDRQLMLFLWAAMRDVAATRSVFAYPKTAPSRAFAQEVLNNDLTGELDVLLSRASYLLSITEGFTESHGDAV